MKTPAGAAPSAGGSASAPPPQPRWEHFEHAADVGVRGRGRTPAEAFAAAAQALFALVADDPASIAAEAEHRFECKAGDLEALFVDFLNELVSAADARRLVFGRFEVEIDRDGPPWRLSCRALGEPYDPERHAATVEPKGATYTALRVAEEGGGWLAQCIVDV